MSARELAPQAVLQKTARGAEEISTRKAGLAARLRSLLILVDGKADVAQLLARGQALGLAMEHLQALVDTGMCKMTAEAVSEAAPQAPVAAMPPETAAGAAGRPQAKRSVAVARMYLLEQMDRFLGAESEPVRVAIRGARSHGEVLQVLELSMEVVRGAAGEARAALLRERVREMLPD